jgi:hypothetical protein
MIKKLISLFCVFNLLFASFAADVFVRSGGGSGSGANWADTLDDLPATLVRGNRYWVAEGTYDYYLFDDAAVGGSLITIKKATVAEHGSDTGWVDTYGDGVANFGGFHIGTSYIVIDGTEEYGIKITMAEGQNGIFMGEQSGSRPGVIIKYVEAVGPGGSTPYFWTLRTTGFYLVNFSGQIPGLTISHCSIHGFETSIQTANTDNLIVEYSALYDSLTSNPNPLAPHPNIAYIQSSDNVFFRYNRISNWANTGFYPNTSGQPGAAMLNQYVYGNVFYNGYSSSAPVAVYPVIAAFNGFYVFNNTFYNIGSNDYIYLAADGATIANGEWKDNLIYGTGVVQGLGAFTTSHNWFTGASTYGTTAGIAGGSTDPFVDGASADFNLANAITGVALASTYNQDPNGNTRGSDGVWDIGAFEYDAGGGVAPNITSDPANQTITSGANATIMVIATGTATLTYQWYEGVSGVTTTPISGATSDSYTTPALLATAQYWVRVSNAFGTDDSTTSTITVSGSGGGESGATTNRFRGTMKGRLQ